MSQSLCYEYPLRPNYLVQLVLPRDLTVSEAARLCGFIRALIIVESAQETDGER